ncbi:uncharacterized protein N7496_012449 [Penicillium cataractarum]|uniref:N-acetyltransferase domain-containing protein n=1 Tax=Penicillium cataractarum TaxID=2100454 RepID=A0A9W9R7V0_9EURO|nr:uncharacterized protein N7496_012449 [Penicillium cataractarum]KAJ5355237.1 hypothetical protein N7496_012449 [Penicillium cataractarum]
MINYRPAKIEDLAQIRDINRHYILNTSLTFVRAPPSFDSYIAKLNDLKSRGLPYLVAVDETQKADDGNDLVVGYGSLSPFRPQMVSYAPTVELTLFIHPDHQSQGSGSVLLALLLGEVETGQVWHIFEEPVISSGSTEADHENEASGAMRVRNVIAVMAVDPEGKEQGEALRKWYVARGFEECGRLKKVGYKRGYW